MQSSNSSVPILKQIRVEVEMRLPFDFPPCNVDRARKKQVLLNLFKTMTGSYIKARLIKGPLFELSGREDREFASLIISRRF